MSTEFRDLVAAHLGRCGMSQRAFAERVGVNQSHLGRMLSGMRPIPIDRLGSWCEVLGLDGAAAAELACAALRLQGADWVADLIAAGAVQGRAADRTERYRTTRTQRRDVP